MAKSASIGSSTGVGNFTVGFTSSFGGEFKLTPQGRDWSSKTWKICLGRSSEFR